MADLGATRDDETRRGGFSRLFTAASRPITGHLDRLKITRRPYAPRTDRVQMRVRV